ncbi:tRNA-binding protein [Myroides sp. JBRI-B21084]|uniref:tRNA-binding protein n=1 Tax=Myroides sp. JBRI-B21084 TaxID=3119977 RepID=UPI0026E248EE|nr:tRNA-binding protein [Paenimyroides cloacae]WKW46753.1 tRNA-binding protein [Paenimyroides cloacae]
MKPEISWNDFEKIDIRVGTVIDAQAFEKAKNPSYKLWIDFGTEIGVKKTSAQITVLYGVDDLIDKQIVAVVNFPPKQIADFMSECLVLGVVGSNKEVTLLAPGKAVENGLTIG